MATNSNDEKTNTTRNLPPPPEGEVLTLVGALSSADNHDLHVQAIKARDDALSKSVESYGGLCYQLACLLAGCDRPPNMLRRMNSSQVETWKQQDPSNANVLLSKLQEQQHRQPNLSPWIPFGQMGGFVLKQALLHPPTLQCASPTHPQKLKLVPPASDQVKSILLYCLGCQSVELRAVASTIVATTSVSADSIQPNLYVTMWPQLMPTLLHNLQLSHTVPEHKSLIDGSLLTIKKMMEDGPHEIRQDQLDVLIPITLRFLSFQEDNYKTSALQTIVAVLNEGIMPNTLVLHFTDYLAGLSSLATDPNPSVRKWVCRSIVTLLVLRTEYIQPHMEPISQFILNSTSETNNPDVALEACEFWLTFCTLDDCCTSEMIDVIRQLLPQLVPVLLRGMVYSSEQQENINYRNELDFQLQEQQQLKQANKPVFHKSKAKGCDSDGYEVDNEGGDDDDYYEDDDDGMQWNLRKCAAASLDSLSGMFGPDPILPTLLPALQEGLSSRDPWHQEASILALGAIADGCRSDMEAHMTQLFPYLLNHLSTPETSATLPQIKCIAAWTVGRYSQWAIGQVQSAAQGHLLAQMTEVFLARLGDHNKRVQVACLSGFGVIVEMAGDLMIPYLEPIYKALVAALPRYESRSLLIVFDTIAILADFAGPAIGEGQLPAIYMPPLLQIWNELASHDPTDRTLLPLMESLASIALTCRMNYQPYALETFDMCMCIIKSVTLILTSQGDVIDTDEEADPIVCAVDLLDGLSESLGPNFASLVQSSQRYGHHFPSALHALTRHEVASVRMSAFALLGDIAKNSPLVLESALPVLLQEAVECLDTFQPQVCNNAVWAIGEICVRCGNNFTPLKPVSPLLMQKLIGILMGDCSDDSGYGGSSIAGLAENSAAAMGRLARVNPSFVGNDLSQFLIGWCDALAKISDPSERRDGYEGFVLAVNANPQSVQGACPNVANALSAILFTIVSWHIPTNGATTSDLLSNSSQCNFQPFPPGEIELQNLLAKLMHDLKALVGDNKWTEVDNQIPVNVRRLLREAYQL